MASFTKLKTISYLMILLNLLMSILNQVNNQNYLDYSYITIFNIQGSCRYCKTLESNQKYSFNQCNNNRDNKQRFHIMRGKSGCNNFSFLSDTLLTGTEKEKYTKYLSSEDFEIISANNIGGVVIKIANQNLCMTNNILDNMIYPYDITENQMFTICQPYNSDEKQVFYFSEWIMNTVSTYGCKTQTSSIITFSYKLTSDNIVSVVDSSLALTGSAISLTGLSNNYNHSVPVLAESSFFLIVEPDSFNINLSINNLDRYEWLSLNLNVSPSSVVTCDLIIKEKIGYIDFIFEKSSNGVVTTVDSSYILTGSNITFGGVFIIPPFNYNYNIPASPVTTFQMKVIFDTYAVNLVLADTYRFSPTSFQASVNTYTPVSYTISIFEKIRDVTFYLKDQSNGNIAITSLTISPIITFTNNSIPTYVETFTTSGETNFNKLLHYGSYTTTLTVLEVYNYKFYTFPVHTFTVDATTVSVDIFINEIKPLFYFKFDNSLINEVTGTVDATTSGVVVDVSDRPSSKSGNSKFIKDRNGIVGNRYNGFTSYTPPIVNSNIYTSIDVPTPDVENTTVAYSGYFYTGSQPSGTWNFNVCADNWGLLSMNGISGVAHVAGLGCINGNISLNTDTYYSIAFDYSNSTGPGFGNLSWMYPGGTYIIDGTDYFYRYNTPSNIEVPGFTKSGNLGITLWIKTMSYYGWIFQFKNSGNGNTFGLYHYQAGNSQFEKDSSFTNSHYFPNNTWCYVTVDINGTTDLKICKDGSSGCFTHSISITNQIYNSNKIGSKADNSGRQGNLYVHKLRMYNVSITSTRMDSLMNEA